MIRILRLQPRRFARFGRLTGFVEALLGRVPAVGVQGGGAAQGVFQPLAVLAGEPDPLLAIEAIVPYQQVGVDAPALAVERVGFRFGQRAGEQDGSQHGAALLPGVLTSSVLFAASKGGNRGSCSNPVEKLSNRSLQKPGKLFSLTR